MTRFALLGLLLLPAAYAQTAPAFVSKAPPTQVTLTDVPAGHWSREAIGVLINKGILLGYPDGTFKGERPISRYEVAVILNRLIQSGLLTKTAFDATELQAISEALQETVGEIAKLQGQISTLQQGQNSQDALIQSNAAKISDVQALVDDLSKTVQAHAGANTTDPAVLERLQALEDAARAGAAAVNLAASSAQVAELQRQVSDLAVKVNTPAPEVKPVPDVPVFPPAQSVPEVKTRPQSQRLRYEFGLAATTPVSGLHLGGMGSLGLYWPSGLGVQVAASYRPSAKAFAGEAVIKKNFSFQNIAPYLGLGGGAVFSPTRGDTSKSSTDAFITTLAGLDYAFNDSVALFAEVAGRYYLSNQGYGPALGVDAKKGFGGEGRMGLKFKF